jgi:hypothetical protein
LPAAELERRWNEILQAVAKIEADIAAKVPIWSWTASEAGLIAGEELETDGPKGRKRRFAVVWGVAFHVGWPTGQRATVP